MGEMSDFIYMWNKKQNKTNEQTQQKQRYREQTDDSQRGRVGG